MDVKDNHAVGQPIVLGTGSVVSGNADGWSFLALVPGLSLLGLVVLLGVVQLSGRWALRKRASQPL